MSASESESALDIVDRYPGKVIKGVPRLIYHYCGIEVFRKIITDKKLWLASAAHMNDTREISFFVENLKALAENEGNDEILDLLSRKPVAEPYLSCFSSNGDLLSQWRAYGDDGAGLAIGFNTNLMERDAAGQFDGREVYSPLGLYLQPIKYGSGWSSYFYQRLVGKMNEGPLSDKYIVYLYHLIDYYSCFEKSAYFSEEAESRIAYFPLIAHSKSSPRPVIIGEVFECIGLTGPNFRESRGRLAPYFEYDLRHAIGKIAKANKAVGSGNLTPICEVVLGPRCQMSEEEVRHFLDNAYFSVGEQRHEIEIRISSGSYG